MQNRRIVLDTNCLLACISSIHIIASISYKKIPMTTNS